MLVTTLSDRNRSIRFHVWIIIRLKQTAKITLHITRLLTSTSVGSLIRAVMYQWLPQQWWFFIEDSSQPDDIYLGQRWFRCGSGSRCWMNAAGCPVFRWPLRTAPDSFETRFGWLKLKELAAVMSYLALVMCLWGRRPGKSSKTCFQVGRSIPAASNILPAMNDPSLYPSDPSSVWLTMANALLSICIDSHMTAD